MEPKVLKWRQRAKENWLKHGDHNTKYFHACANQRQKGNRIVQIQDENGRVCTTNDAIANAFVQYYQHLFTMTEPHNIGSCIHAVGKKLARR
jgi:hypothetical protein